MAGGEVEGRNRNRNSETEKEKRSVRKIAVDNLEVSAAVARLNPVVFAGKGGTGSGGGSESGQECPGSGEDDTDGEGGAE